MPTMRNGLVATSIGAALLLTGCQGAGRPAGAGPTPSADDPPGSSSASVATAPAPVTDPKALDSIATYYKTYDKLWALQGGRVRVVSHTDQQQSVSPDGRHVVTVGEKA